MASLPEDTSASGPPPSALKPSCLPVSSLPAAWSLPCSHPPLGQNFLKPVPGKTSSMEFSDVFSGKKVVCDLVTLGKTQFFTALAGESAFMNSWRRQNTQLASNESDQRILCLGRISRAWFLGNRPRQPHPQCAGLRPFLPRIGSVFPLATLPPSVTLPTWTGFSRVSRLPPGRNRAQITCCEGPT